MVHYGSSSCFYTSCIVFMIIFEHIKQMSFVVLLCVSYSRADFE